MVKLHNNVNVVVIGAGIFGAEVALKSESMGLSVKVFESKNDILCGASMNNQNRLHLGFHYPRNLETGRQSIRGFDAFRQKYSQCIQDDFRNAYFIASHNSLTTPDDYLKFCLDLGVSFSEFSLDRFPVEILGTDMGILCDEVVYDCRILRELVRSRLNTASIDVALGCSVQSVQRHEGQYIVNSSDGGTIIADVVVNASYADINRITNNLGLPTQKNSYEYTAVPIIKLDLPLVGITIMDGPFMTVLPYGKSNDFLLYNVVDSVVASDLAELMNPDWRDTRTAPFFTIDKLSFFNKMKKRCAEYVPALEKAELIGFLEGPRMVLAKSDDTDTRLSIVTDYNGSYFSVFSGKIDHCLWVADEVGVLLEGIF